MLYAVVRLNAYNAISNTFPNYNLIRRNISPFGEDARKGEYAKHKFQKNTQAYFGKCRMLRIGFVFDEPLQTPTYSIKFHTQEYFGFAEDTRLGRVCETQISKNTQAYRSGHNEAVLKTSFVCLCNPLKTLDFIGFFTT